MAAVLPIAIAQSQVGFDPHANGVKMRRLIAEAAQAGARLIQFPEGAASGYPSGEGKSLLKGWQVDWEGLRAELEETAVLAGQLGIWVVAGGNHRLSAPHRPHNSLYVISDQGRLVDRYDKRLLSHSEVHDWYAPGSRPVVIEVDGFRLGLALCIEINFPELFLDYAAMGVDAVLFSSFSRDDVFGVIAQGYAATTNCWFAVSVPAQCSQAMPSGLIGPNGRWLARCPADGSSTLVMARLDRDDPALDMALNKARPWRAIARAGELHAAHRVDDPRSTQTRAF